MWLHCTCVCKLCMFSLLLLKRFLKRSYKPMKNRISYLQWGQWHVTKWVSERERDRARERARERESLFSLLDVTYEEIFLLGGSSLETGKHWGSPSHLTTKQEGHPITLTTATESRQVSHSYPHHVHFMSSKVLSVSHSMGLAAPGSVFCLLLRVNSDYAQPITGQVTEVTCPVIGRAQPELTLSKRQKTSLDYITHWPSMCLCLASQCPTGHDL